MFDRQDKNRWMGRKRQSKKEGKKKQAPMRSRCRRARVNLTDDAGGPCVSKGRITRFVCRSIAGRIEMKMVRGQQCEPSDGAKGELEPTLSLCDIVALLHDGPGDCTEPWMHA
jgi:hypothetical protein